MENWIQKYDHEMGEKQDEFELLGEEYASETAQLKELEEKLAVCQYSNRLLGLRRP